MGNCASTTGARNSVTLGKEPSLLPHDAAYIKVARYYLRCEHDGKPVLVKQLHSESPDQRYLFRFEEKISKGDAVDGKVEPLFTVRLEADRDAKQYYLCAKELGGEEDLTEMRPECEEVDGRRYRVYFDTTTGEETVWRLTKPDSDMYVIRPLRYDVCLAEVSGQLCLQPYDPQKRNNRVRVLYLDDHERDTVTVSEEICRVSAVVLTSEIRSDDKLSKEELIEMTHEIELSSVDLSETISRKQERKERDNNNGNNGDNDSDNDFLR